MKTTIVLRVEDKNLSGCDAVSLGEYIPTFRKQWFFETSGNVPKLYIMSQNAAILSNTALIT